MSQSPRRPLSRDEKRLLVGVPLVLLLGGLIWGRLNARAEIVYPKTVALPNPNGFDMYMAAANALIKAKPAVDTTTDTQDLSKNPKLAAQRYSLARRNTWLRANTKTFTAFHRAQTLPCGYPLVKTVWTNPFSAKLRELAHAKRIEANTLKLQGDWNAATTSALDLIQMGVDITQEGDMDAQSIGSSIEWMGRAPFIETDDVISHLTFAQTGRATKRLESLLKHRQNYTISLENERWKSLRSFDEVRKRPRWKQYYLGWIGSTYTNDFRTLIVTERQVISNINRQFDNSIANVQKKFSQPDIETPSAGDTVTHSFLNWNNERVMKARTEVASSILLLRFALHAYQLENGKYPDTLNQLSPQYLAKVPTDTFADDAPFHYTNKGKTYLLYSVGPNGKDDKGTPMLWHDGKSGPKNGRFPPILPYRTSLGDYVAGANQ